MWRPFFCVCEKFFCFFFFNFRDRNGRFLFGILTAKGVISQHRNPNKLEVISKTKAPHCAFVALAHGICSVSVSSLRSQGLRHVFSAFASVLWTLYLATGFAFLGQNGISVNFRHSDQWLSRSMAAACGSECPASVLLCSPGCVSSPE